MDELEEVEFEMVTMTDENQEEIEFAIIDNVVCGMDRYLLVVETENMDDEESNAIILKEEAIDATDVTYTIVEDDEEFEKVAALFAENDGEYAVEIE